MRLLIPSKIFLDLNSMCTTLLAGNKSHLRSVSRLACAGQNDAIVVNGEAFFHVEDRISEYALPMSS